MSKRFPIRFNPKYVWAYKLTGMPPSRSWIEVDDQELRVQMGIGFRATFPRSSVAGAVRDNDRVWGWGVHGWRGKWLVNGTNEGLVRLTLSPARARVLGFPVALHTLRISVEDPAGLIQALRR